jgi:hypothetical protein
MRDTLGNFPHSRGSSQISTGPTAGLVEAVVHSRGRQDEPLVYQLNWEPRQAMQVTARLPWSGQVRSRGKDIISGGTVPLEQEDNQVVFT